MKKFLQQTYHLWLFAILITLVGCKKDELSLYGESFELNNT